MKKEDELKKWALEYLLLSDEKSQEGFWKKFDKEVAQMSEVDKSLFRKAIIEGIKSVKKDVNKISKKISTIKKQEA